MRQLSLSPVVCVVGLSVAAAFLAPSALSSARAQGPAPAPAPVVQAAKPATAKTADAPIYDEQADAAKDIAAALARAKRENRRVLVQWGANWCGWCKLLDKTMKSDEKLAKELRYEYDVVHVDIGRFDKHMELAQTYGAELKANGVPFLTLLDADGKVLANQETGSLESKEPDKHEHDAAKVLALLTQHEAPRLEAREVYDAAFARARADGKRVFLHFGAPWCGWCHRLEGWMAQPGPAALLAKDFVDVKIDVDRMLHADAIQTQFPKSAKAGIPWFAFLDADGKVLADSTLPDGKNTGYPAAEAEVAHFAAMLDKARVKLTSDDVAALKKSLDEEAVRLKLRP